MRLRACVVAVAAVFATAPQLAGARTDGEPSRPPGPAWTPGAAVSALARLVTRGAEALPVIDQVCTPRVLGVALPSAGRSAVIDLDGRCELGGDLFGSLVSWRPANLDGAAALFALELRDVVAGPTGFLARLLPDVADADFLPDLSTLTTSPVPRTESSGFGWRSDPIHHRAKFHKGTDFRAKQGTPVYAAGPGRVVFVGQQHGYGNIIYVDHGGGVTTRYAHLSRFEIERGALISEGRMIGRVGATGRATGPHLHFEVRLGDRAVEPMLAMAVGALQRTDPAAARVAGLQLAAEVQDHRVDRHDPPGRSRKIERRKHRSGRPERAGAPRRSRDNS